MPEPWFRHHFCEASVKKIDWKRFKKKLKKYMQEIKKDFV